jgi:amidophosphoribosyltransferase
MPVEGLKEECGLFAVFGLPDAALHTALALHAQQHRGQEGAGIVTCADGAFQTLKAPGLVSDHFSADAGGIDLDGDRAVGHVRYSTAGGPGAENIQPLTLNTRFGPVALAHNGTLTNAETLREELLEQGQIFTTKIDTEVILHLLARSKAESFGDALREALSRVTGAFSLLLMTTEAIYAVRDPNGMRPLVMGKLGTATMFASETCAFDTLGARWVRDIEPGEIVRLNGQGLSVKTLENTGPERFCVFEYLYFMRASTVFNSRAVADVRARVGQELAREAPCRADVVLGVPESGIAAAEGFAMAANLPMRAGLMRSPYVGRTFIEPSQRIRSLGVRLKLSINRMIVDGRRVVLVDDSIVRSTTMSKLVALVREAGATEVHVRIASPAIRFPCFYGIDTPSRDELVAAKHDVAAINTIIGADSLAFVSLDGLAKAVNPPQGVSRNGGRDYCDACFSGVYDVDLPDESLRSAIAGSGAVLQGKVVK